jgi:8-amino-7-oxononanoate synthase
MPDFTSSLYLGLRHALAELKPWASLTSGAPAGLLVPRAARSVARRIAALQGCEGAILAPSTLHLFWDLFGTQRARSWELFVDAGAYAVGRWGAERAAGMGVPVRRFGHHDPESLVRSMSERKTGRQRPVVVADGLCPSCGSLAPAKAFLHAVERRGGLVVLDDTQAFGILGHSPTLRQPYGVGGGGSVRFHATEGRPVLTVSSMAKAFGVPMAVFSGPRDLVGSFEAESETRMHCSPVSFADLAAAEHALGVNERFGAPIRERLVGLVRRFRHGIGESAIETSGLFPVQTLARSPGLDPRVLHQDLAARGIPTVLHGPGCGDGVRVSVLITARHTAGQIDEVVDAIAGRAPRTGTEG